jgi:hypothetical protein
MAWPAAARAHAGADALDAALDRALASVPAASGAVWRALPAGSAAARAEHAGERTLPPSPPSSLLEELARAWRLEGGAPAHVAARAAPPLAASRAAYGAPALRDSLAQLDAARHGVGVGAQLDAALREVTAALQRGRVPACDLLPAEQAAGGLPAVRAAAAAAEQRAIDTAVRTRAVRSEAARCRARLGAERAGMPLHKPGVTGWLPAAHAAAAPDAPQPQPVLLHTVRDNLEAPSSATVCSLTELAAGEPAPQRTLAYAARGDAGAWTSREAGAGAAARGELAHAAAHARRTHARAQQQPRSPPASLHSALQRRAAAARVAAAWDSDEEDGGR